MSRRSLIAATGSLLLPSRGSAYPRGGAGIVAAPSGPYNYIMNVAVMTPPAVPSELVQVVGTWKTVTDGSSVNYLTATNANGESTIQFPATSGAPSSATIQAAFLAGSQPTTSVCIFGMCIRPGVGGYYINLSRGSGETNGALYVQKETDTYASVTLLGSLGTAGTTFTSGDKYSFTPTISGTSTVTIGVAVQRASDSKWLTSSATWSATPQTALTVTDSSSPLLAQGAGLLLINQSAADVAVYAAEVFNAVNPWTYYAGGASPILSPGATYGSITAAGLTGVMGCYDSIVGGRVILSVAIWPTTTNQWYCAMFSTTNGHTLGYMSGSIQSPPSGNGLIGDCGITCWQPTGGTYGGVNAYWQAKWYGVDPDGGSGFVDIERSTDTTLQAGNWATIVSELIPYAGHSFGPFGPNLVVNPNNNNLELYTGDGSASGAIYMLYTSDGVTWSDGGTVLPCPYDIIYAFGECRVMYIGTRRFYYCEAATAVAGSAGATSVMQFHSDPPYTSSAVVFDGYAITPNPAVTWRSVDVGLGAVMNLDLGDGNGVIPRGWMAGQFNADPVEATGAALGYIYQVGGY